LYDLSSHTLLLFISILISTGNTPPLFHCFDKSPPLSNINAGSHLLLTRLVLGNLAFWTQASCVVYPSASFSPPAIIDAIIEEGCTALHGVPTHFLGVLEEAAKRGKGNTDFKTLRTGIAAGSPVPIDLMKKLIDKLNLVDLTVAYGMSMSAFCLPMSLKLNILLFTAETRYFDSVTTSPLG
jgi:acyl-CoA synthetase (AMP-forming)/AMP-acid ligase II